MTFQRSGALLGSDVDLGPRGCLADIELMADYMSLADGGWRSVGSCPGVTATGYWAGEQMRLPGQGWSVRGAGRLTVLLKQIWVLVADDEGR